MFEVSLRSLNPAGSPNLCVAISKKHPRINKRTIESLVHCFYKLYINMGKEATSVDQS